jgi:hypothetical protein
VADPTPPAPMRVVGGVCVTERVNVVCGSVVRASVWRVVLCVVWGSVCQDEGNSTVSNVREGTVKGNGTHINAHRSADRRIRGSDSDERAMR